MVRCSALSASASAGGTNQLAGGSSLAVLVANTCMNSESAYPGIC
jgi:hypothetical protein